MESVTSTRSSSSAANNSSALAEKTPCAAAATTRRAPASLQALAAPRRGPPVLIRSSMMTTLLSATSPIRRPILSTPLARGLVHERRGHLTSKTRTKRFVEALRALDTAGIGGENDRGFFPAQGVHELVDEETIRYQVLGPASKGVPKRREVVHLQRHQPVRLYCFEQLGEVADGHWIARLRLAILTRIGQIGSNHRNPTRSGVLQASDRKEQSHQLVVDAQAIVRVERSQQVGVLAPHTLERTDLVLPILEVPLLVLGQGDAERLRHTPGKPATAVQPKKCETLATHWLLPLLSIRQNRADSLQSSD
jgi:hypothetical protein